MQNRRKEMLPKNQEKKDVFILFSDLDWTFSPIGISGYRDFVDILKNIKNQENVEVKFCAVSGRPADYVLSVMHTVRNICKEEGLENVVDYGVGEQGALLVDVNKSYNQEYLGDQNYTNLRKDIARILKENRYGNILSDEPGKRFTSSIHIDKDISKNMSKEQKLEIYDSIKRDILQKLGRKVEVSMSTNCIEFVMPEINKAKGINKVLELYSKKYKVKGIAFAGDNENDKHAILYFSKLAEVPGLKTHVFLPGNAVQSIHSNALEGWKEKNSKASENRILLAEKKYFKGVIHLMKKALEKGTLLTKEQGPTKAMDDLDYHMALRKKNRITGLSMKPNKKNKTQSGRSLHLI
jgi:HAD superfamily hydrolase (TIGR01484 family)